MAADAITFTGEALDRAAEHRGDPDWLAAQALDPAARAVLAGDGGVHVTGDDEPRLALLPLAALDVAAPLLLGLDAAGPVFAVDAEAHSGHTIGAGDWDGRADGTGTRPLGLRAAAASLPLADAGLAAHAAALLNWHRRHAFCANCGAPTDVVAGGIIRACPRCRAEHHPRTDPVVIMLVTDGDRVLLGRQPTWPPGRFSALAGFVEPGESLEQAVAREVREEAGVEVGEPVYIASQPWPFPSSLMLGFIAPWRSGEPRRIDAELEDLGWFERAEVEAAVAGERSSPGLPPRFAIARRLLEHWVQR
jgi:NAD+ diphosphatase